MNRTKQSTRSTKQPPRAQPSRYSPSLPPPTPSPNPPHSRRSISTSRRKDQQRTPTTATNARKPALPTFYHTFQSLSTTIKPDQRPLLTTDFASTPIFPHFSTPPPTFQFRPSLVMQSHNITHYAPKTSHDQLHTIRTSHFSSLFNSPSQPSLLSQVVHPPGMDPKFIDLVSTPTPTPAQQQNMSHIDPELKEKLQTLLVG